MKGNAIARIIIYSVLILVLIGILVVALGANNYFKFGTSGGTPVVGSMNVDESDVRNLEINWASGNITIIRDDIDEILVEEIANGEIKDPMTYNLRGNTLQINYAEGNVRIGFGSLQKKDLNITVPMDWSCGDLIINSASTDVEIREIAADQLELNTASSNCTITNSTIGNLELNGASCDLNYSGSLNSLTCDGASANITAVFTNVPRSIELDGASADLDITLPSNCGYEIDMDGVSNRCTSEFTTSKGSHSYGNGACKITIDGVSATVHIRNGGHHHTEDCSTPNSNCPDNSHSGNHH